MPAKCLKYECCVNASTSEPFSILFLHLECPSHPPKPTSTWLMSTLLKTSTSPFESPQAPVKCLILYGPDFPAIYVALSSNTRLIPLGPGLRLARFGLSSALRNTAGGKQIFSEWRNGNASISSENIRFQYPWKRMQMNDEVDPKKKDTEDKRMRRAVKATSGHTGVFQKFDEPLQWHLTSSVVAAVFHSGTNCVISSHTHAFWKPTTNTQINSTEQNKEGGGLESISLKRQTSSLT